MNNQFFLDSFNIIYSLTQLNSFIKHRLDLFIPDINRAEKQQFLEKWESFDKRRFSFLKMKTKPDGIFISKKEVEVLSTAICSFLYYGNRYGNSTAEEAYLANMLDDLYFDMSEWYKTKFNAIDIPFLEFYRYK